VAASELKPTQPAPPQAGASLAVNVEGYFDTRAGQGEAARLYLRALREAGVSTQTTNVRVADVMPASPAAGLMPQAPGEIEQSELERDADVNLICVNGLELRAFAATRPPGYFTERRCAGVWAWETDAVPETMIEAAGLLDEIWVYSRYVADVLAPALDVPVVVMPLPAVPPRPRGAGVTLDLPDAFTFLFAFDFLATLGRKNPLGTIEAFKRAFEPGEGPNLVLKAINGSLQWQALEEVRGAIASRADIHLIDRVMSGDDKAALFDHCDCYVSLHRSEGYGLSIAEAMALGKPAIATGYSGNREFMTPTNSYLVDYELVGVEAGNEVYPADGRWAEPDLDHAAQRMRHVWEHPDEARAIGGEAHRQMLGRLSPHVIGTMARAQLERLVLTPRAARPTAADGQDAVAELTRHVTFDRDGGAAAGARGLIRRGVLRLMRPFTSPQRRLDEAIVAELRKTREQLDAERVRGERDRRRLRDLEARVDALGPAARDGRRSAASPQRHG